MSQVAGTMPEAKFRSTKKTVKPASAIKISEFSHEVKAFNPAVAKPEKAAKAKAPAKAEAKSDDKDKRFKLTFLSFWPVVVGIFLSGFAAEWHGMAEQIGLWGMRFTFPLSLIAQQRHLLNLSDHMAAVLPNAAIYAQLPIDGLLLTLTFAQTRNLKSAVLQVTLVHAVCAFVLWLITM
jgi:hypothetical protein